MQDKPSDAGKRLKDRIKESVGEATNLAAAVNVGRGGQTTSISTRQKVVHKDGVTTTTTEAYDEKTTTSAGKEGKRDD